MLSAVVRLRRGRGRRLRRRDVDARDHELHDFDPETSCGDTTLHRTITLADGSGTLELDETGTVCFPGKAFFTPGASSGHSYGNPVRISTTWTVTGGTGVFAGASGSGTDEVKTAGDAGGSRLSGTLTL